MTNRTITIATRSSTLALWQANSVKQLLLQQHPHLRVELLPLVTSGDQNLAESLNKIGGKGLFVKELENALLRKDADLAVHSMKDVPAELPAGLVITAMTQRTIPHDALVTSHCLSLMDLPYGARLGTSSLRRQAQCLARRPDFVIKPLRGNIETRLAKLEANEFDAIILASAGLQRLGLSDRIASVLSLEVCLPAVGQGALGIETRQDDAEINALLASINHPDTHDCVLAERAMSALLGGSCQVPVAGYARLIQGTLKLTGVVAAPNGTLLLRSNAQGLRENFQVIGQQVADQLLQQGAANIIKACTPHE